ncbi:MAG: phosphate signaling complex protein PhoU [Magnetococcus sp. WYHC-3]
MNDTIDKHTVKSYGKELQKLLDSVRDMGDLVHSQIERAMFALDHNDTHVATQVIEGDKRIDDLEAQINQLVTRELALRQPMADDLRLIINALKTSGNLERIGDLAANIAKRCLALSRTGNRFPTHNLVYMSERVRRQLVRVLQAFVDGDANSALQVWHEDQEIDAIHTSLFREVLTYMMEDPRNITPCTHLMFIAKNLERMGDHSTNIAEGIFFQVAGAPLREDRPKADRSSVQGDLDAG